MTDPLFILLTAVAVLVALVFVVAPLAGSHHRALLAGLIVLVPAATLSLYAVLGTPAGIDPDTGQTGELRSAVTDLARRALSDPDNAEHWARLGFAYKSLNEFQSAEHAFRRALYIEADNALLKAELAETLLYASEERQLSDEARRLLGEAAQVGSQKAIWLLGLDAFQARDYERAILRFERLLALLPEQSDVRNTVERYLTASRAGQPALARPHAGTDASRSAPRVAEPSKPASPRDENAPGPRLNVHVSIAEALAEGLSGDEVLFVAVRRPQGGPPLAVRRLEARQLPVSIEIDDGDAMMTGSGLSSAESVKVTARISFSGNAMPSAGDFEGESDLVPIDGEQDVEVRIATVR